MFRASWLSFSPIPCCPEFWWYARAGLLTLERGFHSSSISCLCRASAGVIFTLEQVSLRSSGRARAGTLALARVVRFGVSSGREKSKLERTG